jgi:hypothetical protein
VSVSQGEEVAWDARVHWFSRLPESHPGLGTYEIAYGHWIEGDPREALEELKDPESLDQSSERYYEAPRKLSASKWKAAQSGAAAREPH